MSEFGRRRFLVAAAGLIATPVAVRAETKQSSRPFRIGTFPDLPPQLEPTVRKAMTDIGWREGIDYVLVPSKFHYGRSLAEIQAGLKGLLAQRVDLLFVNSTAHALSAHRMARTIPIVVWSCGYPVEAGLADSLARPGKNVTGMTLYAGTGVWGKQLELLRESKPRVERVGVVWSYVPPDFPREEIDPCYAELRSAAHSLGLTVHIEEFPTAERVSTGLQALDAQSPDALILTGGPGIWNSRQRIVEFALSRRLPTISDFKWSSDDPLRPLMSYGGSFLDMIEQAIAYVVRILSDGANPGELPFQQPRKLYLIADLRTARALGVTLPQTILLRADEVIE